MSLSLQKWLRFVTPGFLILVFSWFLGKATGLWGFQLPEKPQEALPTLTVLIPAAIYYLTPLRSSSNQKYFNTVTETLRQRLLEISGINDDKSIYTWNRLRGIFFSLIDSDKSLEKKASIAYFNGYIWTTIADIRVVALSFFALSVGFWLAGAPNGGLCAVIFLVLAALSFPASSYVTKQHVKIGEEQIEIIEHNHLALLKEKLGAVRDRFNNQGN